MTDLTKGTGGQGHEDGPERQVVPPPVPDAPAWAAPPGGPQNQVGQPYGQPPVPYTQTPQKPVSGATGCWYIPGFLILVGPFIWFAKTNGALNEYWASFGTPAQ